LDLDAKEQLVNSIQKNYQKVSIKDTFVENVPLGFSHLNTEFENLLLDFSMSKLVITDRLHGMIFCVITGTPCIVLPNSNHKIRGTYHDWLSNLNYIKLVEDIKDLKLFNSNVEEMLDLDTKVIRKPNLYNDFELLGKALKL
jgi:pyruvyl transferase EpsI